MDVGLSILYVKLLLTLFRHKAINMTAEPPAFRHLLPPPNWWKLKDVETSSARQWYLDRKDHPALKDFFETLELANVDKSYRGFTADGTVVNGLFHYDADEGAPTAAMVDATLHLESLLSVDQRRETLFSSVEDHAIRVWSNPEFYINEGGLRLDECSKSLQDAVHSLIRASLSAEGYAKVRGCCQINHFLGELVNGPGVFNFHSYNFRLFGKPDLIAPWAWTFFGHHACISVFVQGGRMVIGPSFLGAEPNYIDTGPWAGVRLFVSEEKYALAIVRSLSSELRKRAVLFDSVLPARLPGGRWQPHDERHVGGASRDNHIVPYEGCPVKVFNHEQKENVVQLFLAFNEYYPTSVLERRRAIFEAHLDESYFCWYGGTGDEDAFYCRVHSPVAFMEFDFHSGVYLTNTDPDKCHIHTINRIPNQGDYGKALLAQYRAENRAKGGVRAHSGATALFSATERLY